MNGLKNLATHCCLATIRETAIHTSFCCIKIQLNQCHQIDCYRGIDAMCDVAWRRCSNDAMQYYLFTVIDYLLDKRTILVTRTVLVEFKVG